MVIASDGWPHVWHFNRVHVTIEYRSGSSCFGHRRFVARALARVAPSQLEWVDPASEQPAEGVVRLVVDEAIEALLPLSEMVDAAKERARLGKQKAKLEADIEKISNRLNAPGFADKAPPAIIDKAKNELKDFSEQLDGVLSALEQLPTE